MPGNIRLANRLASLKTDWCGVAPRAIRTDKSISLFPPPARPDPAIYSPYDALARTGSAIWNSDDIEMWAQPTLVNGRWQENAGSWLLSQATLNISNLSNEVDAANTRVEVSYSLGYLGAARIPLVTQVIPWLSRGSQQKVQIAFPSALSQALGLVSLFVDIANPYDADTSNNHGQNSTIIVLAPANAGAFELPVGNSTLSNQIYEIGIVGPNPIGAQLVGTTVNLAAGQQATVFVKYEPLVAQSVNSVTVVARDAQRSLVGGVTIVIYAD